MASLKCAEFSSVPLAFPSLHMNTFAYHCVTQLMVQNGVDPAARCRFKELACDDDLALPDITRSQHALL